MAYKGFPICLIHTLRCQRDGGSLSFNDTNRTAFVMNGTFVCESCATAYHVIDGIVRMLEISHLSDIEEKEKQERDKEARVYDARLDVRYEKEVRSIFSKVKLLEGRNVIEYAAGTGRFTIHLASKGARVLAVDFSLSSLEVMKGKIKEEHTIGLVWADASRFTAGVFDMAFAMQFVEHLSLASNRIRFYNTVALHLGESGTFFVSVYHHDIRRRFQKNSQEGFHLNGIFFHYFTIQEFRQELEKVFQVTLLTPIDITLPFENRLRVPKYFAGLVSRSCELIYGLNLFGHLLFAECKKISK